MAARQTSGGADIVGSARLHARLGSSAPIQQDCREMARPRRKAAPVLRGPASERALEVLLYRDAVLSAPRQIGRAGGAMAPGPQGWSCRATARSTEPHAPGWPGGAES